ncbi:hypothetical protein GCM10010112_90100 [Actinoplanes lobatus]|uniref:Uncharacterized protein n=1 Tax=Actinoplanes lobatus TaxID=113568 RepID=A0A7W7MGX5_9ACTN|nr:hypothetical protein [Actinoplanes lobatus]MBB4749897.1 hypothetical protein [Actinoplanes lobatus]GGN97597.1 hypothetical protein GCM10010112_90100 [Actinoplanes lobatus]GIE44989.1 hypothetical protein Alo02nite_78870 [Actinoplanes lobatus]
MTDDDLRERLRRADPAARLEPASPALVEHLVEEAMSRTHVRRWTLPVAAALVLLAGGTAWATLRPGPAPEPVPFPIVAAAPVPSVQVPAGGQAKCAEAKPESLAERATIAFAGRVDEVDDSTALMEVTRNYRGADVPRIAVNQPGGNPELLLGSGDFEVGKEYLVSAVGADVMICGYSGEAGTPGLRELYEAAF